MKKITKNENSILTINIENSGEKYYINSKGKVSEKNFLYSVVNIGDYVKYKEGNEHTYISTKEKNGYEDKKYTTNNSQKWIVLAEV